MPEPLTGACHETMARISAYIDGELPAPECDEIERHCQGCARCAAVVAGLRETVGLCRQVGTTPLPEPVRARARATIRELLEERPDRPR